MNRSEQLAKATKWFEQRGWKPFPFQKQTWTAYLQGKHGLLNSPTGSGKTYALWVPIVLEHLKKSAQKKRPKKGLKAIWITPLRSLANEIQLAAQSFADDMESGLTVGIRSGDTSTAMRAKQMKQMPDLLITTPESLHLMLASKGTADRFGGLNAIVIDEWHELIGSKRGVQMELGLSRLKTLAPNLRIWGISATIGNLEQAREVLLGPTSAALGNSVMIRANVRKKIEVRSIIPAEMDTFPWRGHLGLHLIDEVMPIIEKSKSTLLFTNTRAQAETWFQALLARYPELAGILAMHHGSIDKDMRVWVENAIRNGQLKAVVCTSSLDLGVDFAPVETIVQIGGPKGVARFLQRAGRSGHQPGKTSVIYFLPTHAIELVEASALQKAVQSQTVEDRVPYYRAFDVLVQYLTTLAVGDGFMPDDIWREVQQTWCFHDISEEEWRWCLNFITVGSQTLQAYDEYRKVEIEADGRFKVNNRTVAMRHRMQIGTIVGGENMRVRFMSGGQLGTIEEWSASQLNPGDVFAFAGRMLEMVRTEGMDVLVKKSRAKKGKTISWQGSRMSLSAQMSKLLREELYHHNEPGRSKEIKALQHIFERQQIESIVPAATEFLIETFETREGYHAIFYPFEGRFVHEALASLLAYRLSLLSPITFSIAYNDYGFELLSDQPIDVQGIADNNLFSADYLNDDLQKSLNASEMAKRKFRDIAVISGLVFTGYLHKRKRTRHLQSSSQLLFKVFRDYDPQNLLFRQAYTETFEYQLEEGRLREALDRIAAQAMIWRDCQKPTPFAFPIITDRLREKLTSERLADRIQHMQLAFD